MKCCEEGHHVRVWASNCSSLPRSKVRSGQKIENSDGHEKQLEKRQNQTDSVGKWAPAVLLKALGFPWRVSETLWVGTGTELVG